MGIAAVKKGQRPWDTRLTCAKWRYLLASCDRQPSCGAGVMLQSMTLRVSLAHATA